MCKLQALSIKELIINNMELPVRVIIYIILAIFIFIFSFKMKDKYRGKRHKYRIIVLALIMLLPPLVYFIIPDSVGVVPKFYIILTLSILISVGLIVFSLMRK